MNAVNITPEQGNRSNRRKAWLKAAVGIGALVVAEAAMAASGGPFAKISTFIQSNFMPFIGSVGIAGGIGYGAVHAFKHDYGASRTTPVFLGRTARKGSDYP